MKRILSKSWPGVKLKYVVSIIISLTKREVTQQKLSTVATKIAVTIATILASRI